MGAVINSIIRVVWYCSVGSSEVCYIGRIINLNVHITWCVSVCFVVVAIIRYVFFRICVLLCFCLGVFIEELLPFFVWDGAVAGLN